MQAAGRVHGLWAMGISLVLIVGAISGMGIRRTVLAEQNQTNAKRLVEALIKADTTQVPDIVKQLSDYRKWADPLLTDGLSSAADDSVEKLHLSLALLDQFPAICEALRSSGYRPTRVRPNVERLCSIVQTPAPGLPDAAEVAHPGRRFALPWAKMFKPVGLKTQEPNTAHNSMHSSFSMH